ncbi:hypothetical protein ZWY2020_036743 [Hordeum vulgare]|nr:hypothetical protein ZWY2020_036743 [Hordeum vulgare]
MTAAASSNARPAMNPPPMSSTRMGGMPSSGRVEDPRGLNGAPVHVRVGRAAPDVERDAGHVEPLALGGAEGSRTSSSCAPYLVPRSTWPRRRQGP